MILNLLSVAVSCRQCYAPLAFRSGIGEHRAPVLKKVDPSGANGTVEMGNREIGKLNLKHLKLHSPTTKCS